MPFLYGGEILNGNGSGGGSGGGSGFPQISFEVNGEDGCLYLISPATQTDIQFLITDTGEIHAII